MIKYASQKSQLLIEIEGYCNPLYLYIYLDLRDRLILLREDNDEGLNNEETEDSVETVAGN